MSIRDDEKARFRRPSPGRRPASPPGPPPPPPVPPRPLTPQERRQQREDARAERSFQQRQRSQQTQQARETHRAGEREGATGTTQPSGANARPPATSGVAAARERTEAMRERRQLEIEEREERAFIQGLIRDYGSGSFDAEVFIGESSALRMTAFLDFVTPGNWSPEERNSVLENVEEFFLLVARTADPAALLANFHAVSQMIGSYNREDIDYRFTESTVEWIANNPLALTTNLVQGNMSDDPQVLAQQILDYVEMQIAALAEQGIHIEIPDLQDMNAKEALEAYLTQLWPIIERGAPVMDIGAPLAPHEIVGASLDDPATMIDETLYWQQEFDELSELYLTFGMDASTDVVEYAQVNLGLQGSDPDEANALVRDYLIGLINTYDPQLLQNLDVDRVPTSMLLEFSTAVTDEAFIAADFQARAVLASLPEHERANAHTAMLPDPIVYGTQMDMNLLVAAEYQDEVQQLEQLQQNLSQIGVDLDELNGLAAAYSSSVDYSPTLDQMLPPDLALALGVASVLIEPVDWAMSIPLVIEDFLNGRTERALQTLGAMATPFVAGYLARRGGNQPDGTVYAGFDPFNPPARFAPDEPVGGGSDALVPGSPEHKSARWAEYQANPDSAGWSYERWSQNYDQNMVRAREAQAQVEAYHETLGWGTTDQTTIVTSAGGRRLDIIDAENERGVEYKSGSYFHRDSEILAEIEKDAILVQRGWQITWVFDVTDGISQPLLDALNSAGITVIVNGVEV